MKNWLRNLALALSLVATGAVAQMNNPGAPGNVTAGNNLSQSGSIIGIAAPVTVPNGGTGTTSASGTALDNITGFSGTGFMNRTGSGAYSFVGSTGSGSVVLGTSPAIATPTVTGGSISGATGSFTTLGATTTNPSLTYTATGTGATARNYTAKFADNPASLDYNVLCNGSADDSTAIQNAVNANAGKIVHFPYTGSPCIINTAITQSTPPVSFSVDAGVTFGGTVAALPAAYTNPQQVNVGNYFVQQPAYANTNGASPLQLESLPTSAFTGNAVALYAATRAPLGNPAFTGLLWAGNFLTTLSQSTGTYNGQVLELDLNNHYKNSAGYGQIITGLGEFHSTAAISVDRGDTTSDWQTGIWVKKFQTYGINIDASTSQAPQYGLSIGGMDSGHIRITPKDTANPGSNVILVQDSTGTTNEFTVAANGATRIGAGSSAITGVTFGHINSIAVGTIPANSSVDVNETITATFGNTNCIVSFYGGGETTGLSVTGWVSSNNTLTLRFTNATTSAMSSVTVNVIYTAFTTQ